MKLNDYQLMAREFAIYPVIGFAHIYPALGLSGEVGEVMEKIKKLHRDKEGVIDDEFKEAIKKELGDTFWYFSELCASFGFTLEEVARGNLVKLTIRADNNTLQGSGDDR